MPENSKQRRINAVVHLRTEEVDDEIYKRLPKWCQIVLTISRQKQGVSEKNKV